MREWQRRWQRGVDWRGHLSPRMVSTFHYFCIHVHSHAFQSNQSPAVFLKWRLQELIFGLNQSQILCWHNVSSSHEQSQDSVKMREWRDSGAWRIGGGDWRHPPGHDGISYWLNSHTLTYLSASLISHDTLPHIRPQELKQDVCFASTQCIAVQRARPGLLGGWDKATAEGGLCLQEMAGDGMSLNSLQVHALTLFSG